MMKAINLILRYRSDALAIVICSVNLCLSGCHHSTDAVDVAGRVASSTKGEPPAAADTNGDNAGDSILLTANEIQNMGLDTRALKVTKRIAEVLGYGVVQGHEAIAIAVAELRTATATAALSHAALARSQRLIGTPGAMPADTEETAAKQANVDETALALARRRLSSIVGLPQDWHEKQRSKNLEALADGSDKLVHVTFPAASLAALKPTTLSIAPIVFAPVGGVQSLPRWKTTVIWRAPADPALPGPSFFALLDGSAASEGARVLVWAPLGAAQSGIEVPATAAVISNGKYWCYVEKKPGTYERVELDPTASTETGYFVTNGLSDGDRIVTLGAGLLLAHQTKPSSAAD